MRKHPGVWAAVLLLAASLAKADTDAAAFDAILDDALHTWRTPGVAAVVVRDDEVIYLKGAGIREQSKNDPVTPDTRFAIGSLTKAFTATAVAQLIDDGQMDWDDPVRKHLPSFRLADPLADRDVTLRDLLCHRTGLAANDLLWRYAPWSLEESVRRMAYLGPSHSFRAAYEYNNLGYIAAGLAVGSASKGSWRDDLQKRLLDPLGMTGAVFTRSEVLKSADHASPHRRNAEDKIDVISWYNDDDQVRGSGSLKMGVRDLSRWIRFHLAGGVLDGKRLVSASALAETHTPQIVMPLDHDLAAMTETTQMSYGLGWRISDYRGRPLWDHGGAVDGFRAHILLAPKDKIGVAVLVNLEDAQIVDAVGYSLLDAALGLPKKDWNGFFAKRLKEAAEQRKAKAAKREASRKPGTKPSHDLDAYRGTYEDPAYGAVQVRLDGGSLRLHWSSFDKPLRHFHYDTFQVDEADVPGASPLAGELATFSLDIEGQADMVRFLGRKFKRTRTLP
ncbi:MAG TPA: serine hydrolase [Gemmataceae bacterium]|nr:serine hydrolase [Gemmataceae bacterium]